MPSVDMAVNESKTESAGPVGGFMSQNNSTDNFGSTSDLVGLAERTQSAKDKGKNDSGCMLCSNCSDWISMRNFVLTVVEAPISRSVAPPVLNNYSAIHTLSGAIQHGSVVLRYLLIIIYFQAT